MQWVKRLIIVSALAVSLPSVAHAEPPAAGGSSPSSAAEKQKAAEEIAGRAFEAYKRGDYQAALTLYQQALQITPEAAIEFNVASIYDKKLSDPEHAIEHYHRVIAASDATPELTVKSAARIDVLKEQMSQKKPAAVDAPKEAPPSPPSDAGKTQRRVGFAIGVGGLLAVGAGFGFGADALVQRNNARKTCDGANCTTQGGIDAMHAASQVGTVSTILVAAGGGLFALGGLLVLLAPSQTKTTTALGGGGSASLTLAPVVGPTSAGVGVSGAF